MSEINWEDHCSIKSFFHPSLVDKIHSPIWKDTGEQVEGSGAFINVSGAQQWIKENIKECLDKRFEKTFLTDNS